MKIWNRAQLVFLTLTLLLATFTPGLAQDSPLSLHLDWVDTTAFPKVVVNLSAWDVDGLPLADLSPEDFTLQEDEGATFHPEVVEADPQAPLSVMLVLDISESMFGEPIDDAQDAATRFLDKLETGDRAAVLAFSDQLDPDPATLDPALELDFSADLDPTYDLIETLNANGKTHLYQAAAKAVRLTDQEKEGHRAILLLTDGRNEPAEVGDPEEAIRLAKEFNIPFFVIGLGNQIDEPYLRHLANETGGLFRAAPRSSELAHLFADMATLLKTQYQLRYTSTLPADGSTHNLAVTLNAAGGTATERLTFGPLPESLPTATPTSPPPTATTAPTSIPTFTPLPPTATALAPASTSTPTPSPTLWEQFTRSPWAWLGGGAVLVFLLWLLLFGRRKSEPKPEVCAKCGHDMTGKSGACPQCGETKRLPKR